MIGGQGHRQPQAGSAYFAGDGARGFRATVAASGLKMQPLDPRRLLHALDAIDRDWRDPARSGWRRPALVLAVTALCLLVIHYGKFHDTFRGLLGLVLGEGQARTWLASAYGVLLTEAWWGLVHLFGYVLVPWAFLRWVLNERLADYGLRWAGTTRWLGWCALLATPIVVGAWVVSDTAGFQATYPFYGLAGRSVADLLAWQFIYLAQFVMLEFFFRGFLLHALAPSFGASAVFVMTVPYAMIHFGKPWPEATGAIAFGILLGIIALRSRSIWGGACVHMTIAVAMDLMALARTGRLPTDWWPS